MLHRRIELLGVALLAGALLMVLVSAAAASRLRFSNQLIRAVWSGENLMNIAGITCPVTFEGSFHSRTIRKSPPLLVGMITRAMVTQASCVGGTVRILNGSETMVNTLPWHMEYLGFTGGLPNITALEFRIIGPSFQLMGPCLYRGSEATPLRVRMELNGTGGVVALRIDETRQIAKNEGMICPAEIAVSGKAAVTVLGETVSISVALVP